jgi:hypothetical protein
VSAKGQRAILSQVGALAVVVIQRRCSHESEHEQTTLMCTRRRTKPTLEDCANLQYVGMVIKEAMRIKPSVGELPFRMCKEVCWACGWATRVLCHV